MSIEKVRDYFRPLGRENDILEFPVSSATVELAAQAVGVIPARIAKTLSFMAGDRPLFIVMAGDARIDNPKYKHLFGAKARMMDADTLVSLTGLHFGGVCPFGVADKVEVWLDDSLRRFTTVYPACGTSNSAIEVTLPELERFSRARGWVDVGKLPV